MEEYVPNVEIKKYTSEYREKVRDIVMNLEKFYPGIDVWLEKELKKLDNGIDLCWMIINGNNKVVGVAITGLELENIAKLKTFYLSEEFSGYALGVKLLKTVLNYWMEKRIKNIFVTFAEEELDELKGFFDKFGFLMDGMRPQYYRPEKTEYYMSKTFVYKEVDESTFSDFVRDYLLRMRGIIPTSKGLEFLANEDNKLSKNPHNVYVKIVKDKNIDSSTLFKYLEGKINETKSLYGIIASYYPLLEVADNEKIKVIDGYSMENMFFPLRLKRSGNSGLILPIIEQYAEELLQIDAPQRKIARKRLMFTHERVYYTGKDEFFDVARGGVFLFYVTGGRLHGGIMGEAKIKILDRNLNVSDAIKKYVHQGVIKTEEDLRKHSKNGKVSIFLLTHVKRYSKKVSLDEIRSIMPNVEFTCHPVNDYQIDKIRELANNNLFSY